LVLIVELVQNFEIEYGRISEVGGERYFWTNLESYADRRFIAAFITLKCHRWADTGENKLASSKGAGLYCRRPL
jgi:hypothetical protein